jgi:phosphopantothenoylcysteine decarboxylase/phosphopantothenate--cysteine ligase
MNCIVTAGPTYEPLDQVRRLTNFSSGKLGASLANFLVDRGHSVTLLMGHYATHHCELKAQRLQVFTTTQDLADRLKAAASSDVHAVFHAAAVSDFGFGKIWERTEDGRLVEATAGKISTRSPHPLLAELVPTPKIIRELRAWYPTACVVGWKYEVDGKREDVVTKAKQQISDCKTSASVANGPAYGFGFGIVTADEVRHYSDTNDLFGALERTVLKTRVK